MIKSIVLVLLSSVLLAACQGGEATQANPLNADSSSEEAAADAVIEFFGALEAGDYAEAASYFGGSYQILRDYNPKVEPDDAATLFRNACSINGFSCLKVREVMLVERPREYEFTFNVTFSTREGGLFVLGPCCGTTEEEQPAVSVFPVRVVRGEDGRFRVLDLPPYRS